MRTILAGSIRSPSVKDQHVLFFRERRWAEDEFDNRGGSVCTSKNDQHARRDTTIYSSSRTRGKRQFDYGSIRRSTPLREGVRKDEFDYSMTWDRIFVSGDGRLQTTGHPEHKIINETNLNKIKPLGKHCRSCYRSLRRYRLSPRRLAAYSLTIFGHPDQAE